jgi:hypothetical protein
MTQPITTLLCLAIALLATAQARSSDLESAEEKANVAELGTVNIQGRQDTGPKITTDKLLNVPGANGDPIRAMEALPGVVLSGDDDGEPAVRGSSPEDNLYLTDHMPVGYLFHNDGSSTYNTNIIEDFSLKAGAWDAQYYNAIGAVLDTKLRDPYHEDFTTTLDLSFIRAGILFEGAVSENSAIYVSYRESLLKWYFNNIHDKDEDVTLQVPKNSDYQVKYHVRLSDVSNLKFVALGAKDRVSFELGEDFKEAKSEPTLVGSGAVNGYYNTQGVIFDTIFEGGTSGLFVASHKEEDFKFKIGSLFDLTATEDDNRIKAHFQTPLNNGDNVRYGFESRQLNIRYKMDGLYNPCNGEVEVCDPASLAERFNSSEKFTMQGMQVFAAYDWLATPFWQITLGLTSDYDDYLKEPNLQPRLASRYELNNQWTLTSAVGKHYQFPRDFFAITKTLGSPELKQANSEHYVLGFEYALNNIVSAKLEVYYKDIHDLIVSNPAYEDDKKTPNITKYTNNADGNAQGIELLINKNLSDKWYGWMSVAYSKTQRTNNNTNERFNFSYDRPWIVNLVASYQYDKDITIGAKWRYQSGGLITPISGSTPYYQCVDGADTTLVKDSGIAGCTGTVAKSDGTNHDVYLHDPTEGKINSERLPAKHGLDLRLDYTPKEGRTYYIDLRNAYTRQNITDYEYSDDYSQRFAVSELETIPSIGLKFTF